MASVDEKFIQRLDDFTKALGGIVDLLNEEKGKKNVDPVNTLAKNVGEELSKVVENLQKVTKKVDVIEKDTKEILKQLKAAKEKKKGGGEGGGEGGGIAGIQNVAEVDNKKKIVEAIKVVGLITASIVAVGLALKLISPVSMGSAIAIGLSILLITEAFVVAHKKLGDTKIGRIWEISKMMLLMSGTLLAASAILVLAPNITLSKAASLVFVAGAMGLSLVLITKALDKGSIKPEHYPKIMMLPLILPLIALGIVVSSRILAGVVPLSFGQVMTSLFVGATIGGIIYAMSLTLGKTELKPSTIFGFLLLPVIVPALALGIVLASNILKNIQSLTFAQALSAIFIAGTIGVLIYLMKPIIEKMKGITVGQIFGLMGIIIALSAGIVISSHILGFIHPFTFREALSVFMTSVAIGLAVLAMVPAIYLLKKINPMDALKAAGNIIIIAGSIALSSWAISMGNYDYYPDWEWSLGAGLAITIFGGVAFLIDKLKIKPPDMLKAGLVMVITAGVIMAVSLILGIGNYDIYPSFQWAMGAGLSIVAFGGAMVAIGLLIAATGGTGALILLAGAAGVLAVAATVMATSLILAEGNYSEYPSLQWALGVGAVLLAFSAIGLVSILGAIGLPFLLATAGTVALVSNILSKGNYDEYPSLEWSLGVGAILSAFSTIGLSLIPFVLLGGGRAIKRVAERIVEVSDILSEGTYSGGPTKQWAEGVGEAIKSFAFGILALNATGGILGTLLGIDQTRKIEGVAMAMLKANQILSEGDWYGNYPTESWAKGVGGAILAFANGLLALSKSDNLIGKIFGTQDQSVKIVSIARAMQIANELISSQNWTENYPSEEWAKGVGGAINAFAEGLMKLSKSDSLIGKIFGKDQGEKIISIANAMRYANEAIGSVRWSDNYPSEAWAKGVGGAINAFADPLAKLGEAKVKGANVIFGMVGLVNGMRMAAEVMNKVDWVRITKNYPSEEWASAVGTAINAFAEPLAKMSEAGMSMRDISRGINRLIEGMIFAATRLSDYDWTTTDNYPKQDWVNGVGSGIGMFVKYLEQIEKSDIGRGDIKNLKRTIEAMVYTARMFSRQGLSGLLFGSMWDTYPSAEWSEGVGKAVGYFVKFLAEIEKSDAGKSDVKVLSSLIDKMVYTARRFSKNEDIWNAYPSKDWGDSVSLAVGNFVKFLEKIEKADIDKGDSDVLGTIISKMVYAGKRFSDNPEIWSIYPSSEWGKEVSASVMQFVNIVSKISKSKLDFDNFDRVLYKMETIASEFTKLGDIWSVYPPSEWSSAISQSISNFISSAASVGETDLSVVGGFKNITNTMIEMGSDFEKAGDIWKNYPKMEWVESIGASIYTFVAASDELKNADVSVVKNITDQMIKIAQSFESYGPDIWKIYPPIEWSESVGLATESFLNSASIASQGADLTTFKSLAAEMINMANTFKEAGMDIWSVYPPREWVDSVGNAVKLFLGQMNEVAQIGAVSPDLLYLASSMIELAKAFSQQGGEIWSAYPSQDWSNAVSSSLKNFVLSIKDFGGYDKSKLSAFENVAYAMFDIASIFSENKDIWSYYPPDDWAKSIKKSIDIFVDMIKDSGLGLFATLRLRNFDILLHVMLQTAEILNKAGDIWRNVPSENWSNSMKKAFISFSDILNLDFNLEKMKRVDVITSVIISIGNRFAKAGNIWKNLPSKEWLESIGKSIKSFGDAIVTKFNIMDMILFDLLVKELIRTADKFNEAGDIWNNVPSEKWSNSLLVATNSFVKVLSIGGFDLVDTILFDRLVNDIIKTGRKFSESGDIWKNIPSTEWGKSIRESILNYVDILISINEKEIKGTETGNLNKLVQEMLKTSSIFESSDWNKYPSKEWSDGVNSAVTSFVDIVNKSQDVESTRSLDSLGESILSFAKNMAKLDQYSDFFKPGGALDNFTTSINKLFENVPGDTAISALDRVSQAIERISTTGFSSMFSIRMLARSISALGDSLQDLDLEAVDKLSKFSSGFLILSLIDEEKLEDTIKTLKSQSEQISSILSDQGRTVVATTASRAIGENVVGAGIEEGVGKENIYSEMLNVIKSIDKNVDRIANNPPKTNLTEDADNIPPYTPELANK